MRKILIILILIMSYFIVGCTPNEVIPEGENQPSNPGEGENQPDPSDPGQATEGDGGGSTEGQGGSPTVISVSSVTLNKSSLEMFIDDEAYLLVATILPIDATNKNVTWESSNTLVATVTDGSVTPLSEGNTVITVTTVDGNKSARCNVTIKKRVVIPNYVLYGLFYQNTEWTDKQMVINPYSATEYMLQGVSLHENDVFRVHMSGDIWYGYSDVKRSVKSGLVTQASSDNNIKVLKTGTYDIYCNLYSSDGGHIYLAKTDDVPPTPTDVKVTGISLSNSGKFLLVRNEFIITPTIYPNNATNQDIIWTSSDTSIATVTKAGRVVASVNSKVGSTTITAKTVDGNFTATCIVYVSASQYPDYCLTGTINGKSYTGISMRYAAIPLGGGSYLIPDVELVGGDSLTITGNNGARLRNKYNQVYTKDITTKMSVNIIININAQNKDYISFQAK